MFAFRHGVRRATRLLPPPRSPVPKRFASRIEIPFTPPIFPVIEACPAPTCQCRESPPDLDIEREQNLNGSMAAYGEQVLISTGRQDWHSRIDEDEDAVLARQLKKYLTRGGKFADADQKKPYHNVLVTHSSFPPTRSDHPPRSGKDPDVVSQAVPSTPPASAFLLPSFQYIPSIPTHDTSVEAFIKAFILPHKLHTQHHRLTRAEQNILRREPELQRQFVGARKVEEILVLICGHGGRDDRCGKLGPILGAEFGDKLRRQNIAVLEDAPMAEAVDMNTSVRGYTPRARIGMISHIGGHKWAGNVIIYIPPGFDSHPLAGKGIWYGRVGPEHVEGIVGKTIVDGKVIKEFFRGGIEQDGNLLRL